MKKHKPKSSIEIDKRKGLLIDYDNWHLWTTLDSNSLRRKYIIAELINGSYYNHKMYEDLEDTIMDMVYLSKGSTALYPHGQGTQPYLYKQRQRKGKTKCIN